MSILEKPVSLQDSPHNFVQIRPDGDNPLDLYAIFSRSRYRTDYQGILRDRDSRIVNKKAKAIYHDAEQLKNRSDRDCVRLQVHKNMIRVKVDSILQDLPVIKSQRGNVAGFSNKSRKRMIDLMNSQRHGSPKAFVSLTYADEALFSVSESDTVKRVTRSEDWKNHLEILRKRFERKYPNIKAIWRIELKKRKSGEFRGLIAPHFHMLIFDDDETIGAWLQQTWYEILKTGLQKHFEHGTHVSTVKSARHAMFYVSKYVAKTEDEFEDNYEVGRRWGRIGKFDTSISMEINLSEKEYIQFRRLLRSWLKSKRCNYVKRMAKISLNKGFTVYGIGDNQDIGDIMPDFGIIMKLICHAIDVVPILSVDS